jgi:hypothetical protein
LIDSEAIENLRRTLDSNDNSSERFSIATDEESRPGSGGSSKLNLYGTNNHSDSMVQSKKSDRPHHQRRKSSLNHYLNEVRTSTGIKPCRANISGLFLSLEVCCDQSCCG